MALKTNSIQFDELTADPGAPVEGQIWYNTTSMQLKGYINGATEVIIDKTTFDAHATSSLNPHTVTLEQARTGGATLSGDINMQGNNLTNVGGTGGTFNAASEDYVVDQIKQRLRGLDWQESVLDKDLVTAPGAPTLGDRYIIAGIGGAWSTATIGDIAEWDGVAWVFSTPNEGFATRVEDENVLYIHDGAAWGTFGSAIDHGTLIGLGDDDHTQYLLVSGTRAMTGNLNMGTFAITNVGNVDGVDVSDHSARHDPGGTDALTTAAPGATGVATASAVGVATSFARSDHAHQSNTAPVNVTKAAAAIGTSGEPARADHKHDISAAAANTISVGDAAAEGAATSLARSDHTHALTAPPAPANVTKAAAAAGVATTVARSDHKHDVTTAAPAATGVATASGDGVATTLARSDHTHQSNTAPANVTKAAAAIGTSGEPARADHKHDVATAAPGATGVGTASAEGASTSLARADHVHQSNTAPTDTTKAAAVIGTSGQPARADHKHDISTAAPSTVGTANAEGAATSLARSNHVHDHGSQTTEGHHALVSATNHGFQPRSNRNASTNPTSAEDSGDGYAVGSYWVNTTLDIAYLCVDATLANAVWVNIGAAGLVVSLAHKAGHVLAAGFAGNPKVATVTFSAAFADVNYAVVLTAVTQNNKQFAMNVQSQVAGSFVINMGTNNIADLLQVNWVAMKDGESS